MSTDYTDRVIQEWVSVRPNVDVLPLAVINRVLRLARYLESDLNAVAARYGLSHKGDFDTLAALRRRLPLNEMSPTDLAEAALITTGGMTSRLDRLEQAGLVRRVADPDDRRSLKVHITEEGRALVDDVFDASLERQRDALVALDRAEQETLAGLLKDLLIQSGDEPI